jgi:RNA polymerase sigma-32 factor
MTKELALNTPSLTGSLESYINFAFSIPMLSQEEEFMLARDLRENGNLESARKLVLAHLKFVIKVAKGFKGYGLSENDLIQEGNLGLMKAVKKFDPNVGVRLVTFAAHWIRAEIHEFIIRNWRIVKVATTKAQRKLFFNLRGSKKTNDWLSKDEVIELANKLSVKKSDVETMEQRLYCTDMHAETVAKDEGTPEKLTLEIAFEGSDPYEDLMLDELKNHREKELKQAISTLDERTKDIIFSRWLKTPKDTLSELANRHGVSGERIRQLEQGAMKKMRSSLTVLK